MNQMGFSTKRYIGAKRKENVLVKVWDTLNLQQSQSFKWHLRQLFEDVIVHKWTKIAPDKRNTLLSYKKEFAFSGKKK